MDVQTSNASDGYDAAGSSSTVLATPPIPIPPPAVRGRPRSTSISSGSPCPPPGASALPSLFPDLNGNGLPSQHASVKSAYAGILSNGRGRGTASGSGSHGQPGLEAEGSRHKSSLSVPGIVSPLPISPAGRVGRHRRTQSISPPGFPDLSEGSVPGFEKAGAGRKGDGELVPRNREESPSRSSLRLSLAGAPPRINIMSGRSVSPASSHRSTPPHSPNDSPSSSYSAESSISSHSSTRSHSHAPHQYPSSHAALLSGIRSHSLPHSLVSDSPHMVSRSPPTSSFMPSPRPASPVLSSSPQSPPFGPTPVNAYSPSPLALEVHRRSPDLMMEEAARFRGGVGEGMGSREPGGFGDSFEHVSLGSPPLLPVVFGDTLPVPAPIPIGRPRRGSFGAINSPPSPALQYLEEEGRTLAKERRTTSPPPPTSLFALGGVSPPIPSIISPPTVTSAVVGRSRSRSFTTERNFAPNPFPPSEQSPLSGVPSFGLVSLPPTSPPLIPSDNHTNISLDLLRPPCPNGNDVPSPSSPHHGTISLPPPVAAPAPLPPHLGGPPLHNSGPGSPRFVGSKSARAAASSSALAIKLATMGTNGSEHAPKFRSPLASPALVKPDDEMDGKVAETLVTEEDRMADVVEEENGMDLGGAPILPRARSLSPCGPPVHQEIASYRPLATDSSSQSDWNEQRPLSAPLPPPIQPPTSLQQTYDNDDIDEGFASSSPPQGTLFGSAVTNFGASSYDITEIASTLGVDSARSEREASVSPPPVLDAIVPSVSNFGGLGFMDVDVPSGLGLDTLVHDGVPTTMVVPDRDVIAIDEDSLSALERIFLCARSEQMNERARVAHHLADWLNAVDICEAVEYVLPLLAGLATDPEEIVKEVFAPQVDAIMWHFFSRCPLLELEGSPPSSTTNLAAEDDPSPTGSPVPSRYTPLEDPPHRSPTSTYFPSDDSGFAFTPPLTSKTSPSNTEVSDVPRISATTFTSLLGALLTDQSQVVGKAAQVCLVQFLCRLKGKPYSEDFQHPPQSPSLSLHNSDQIPPPPLRHSESSNHQHSPYQLTSDACKILEDEVVTGIVLGLARLDEDERDGDKGKDGVDALDSQRSGSRRGGSSVFGDGGRSDDGRQPRSPALVLSPEEEQIEDGWLSSSLSPQEPPPLVVDDWGVDPLVSYFDSSPDPGKSGDSYGLPLSSPLEPMYSTFSPDLQGDEESAIGKVVSMNLIAAIATAGCLEPEALVQQFLPEVDRMKSEPAFYVRKEAMQALACLARALPVEVFEDLVLPLHSAFAHDSLWHVRRAACLALPFICKRLPPPLRRKQVVDHIQTFSTDASRNVRSAALEICGELVYSFDGDADGVPTELVGFFLGTTTPRAPSTSPPVETPHDNIFTPLQSALDSPADGFFDGFPSWGSNNLFGSAQNGTKDPDRPVMCAFNFPAVALTLGRDQWHVLAPYYATLTQDKADKVRQSLASSLHEIAKIIGPDQSDSFLLEPFACFVRDYDNIQGAVLENLSGLLRSFGIDSGRRALEVLADAWDGIKAWRRREAIMRELGEVGPAYVGNGAIEEVLSVLAKGFKDSVAAVRERAVSSLPSIFAATSSCSIAQSKLWAFLSVWSQDSSYRNRLTYTSCALAAVRGGIERERFEAYFVDALSRLARDGVVSVRIGVARVIGEACRSDNLYADPSTRDPIRETLYTLAHSPDRDVCNAVLSFCPLSPPPTSPSQTSLAPSSPPRPSDPFGAQGSVESPYSRVIPLVRMTDKRFGVAMGEDVPMSMAVDEQMVVGTPTTTGEEEMHDVEMQEFEEVDVNEGQGPGLEKTREQAAVTSSPKLWTRELEGDDCEFLEVFGA